MTKDDFLNFYNKVIFHFCDEFLKSLREECGRDDYKVIDNALAIYEEYLNQKTMMKIIMDKTEEGQLLDRHKVCAAMTIAILKTRPIIRTTVEDVNGQYKLPEATKINEQIAFYSSWSLLLAFVEDADPMGHTLQNWKLPETTHNKDFSDTFSRSLFLANAQNSLCPELIANIYFLLESYNKALEKNTLVPNSPKRI